jgi:hypothetical protein
MQRLVMQPDVIAPRREFEVLNPIVAWILVLVMYEFIRSQQPTNARGHHPARVQHLRSVAADDSPASLLTVKRQTSVARRSLASASRDPATPWRAEPYNAI